MKLPYLVALGVPLLASPAMAADLTVKFELPQLNVAEYHRPYAAFWIEGADQSHVLNLTVLYDVKKKDDGGAKWLKDVRSGGARAAATSRRRSTASPARRAARASTP
jgi:hypothetical protein